MSSEKLEEKEVKILREAVDKAEKKKQVKSANSPQIVKIMKIVENFIKSKPVVCYGGTAINNILPPKFQFYDRKVDIPDYDFYSANALNDAKELANIYKNQGYDDVEAKAGVHHGTFKVFVNFIPVADITSIDDELLEKLIEKAITINGINYAPPNFLRMGMYLELSRPDGDTSRWEKVLKRLILLNKQYPLKQKKCDNIKFQRDFEGNLKDRNKVYDIVKNTIIDLKQIFFGGYAATLYSRYMPPQYRRKLKSIPDFDILSMDPEKTALLIKKNLIQNGFSNIVLTEHAGIGEIIAPHWQIAVNEDTVAFIYLPLACHSYNTIKIKNKLIRVATIDTMLSFYLAFIYSDRDYYDTDRIICMAQYLLDVQMRNRLQQKGLLRRFSINCYGYQPTLEDIRAEKGQKFEELKNKKGSKEYEDYFLRFIPSKKQTKKNKIKSKSKSKTKSKKT